MGAAEHGSCSGWQWGCGAGGEDLSCWGHHLILYGGWEDMRGLGCVLWEALFGGGWGSWWLCTYPLCLRPPQVLLCSAHHPDAAGAVQRAGAAASPALPHRATPRGTRSPSCLSLSLPNPLPTSLHHPLPLILSPLHPLPIFALSSPNITWYSPQPLPYLVPSLL